MGKLRKMPASHESFEDREILKFAQESNQIEGIENDARDLIHAKALQRFLAEKEISIASLTDFVETVEPRLRGKAFRKDPHQRVSIGGRSAMAPENVEPFLKRVLAYIPIGIATPWDVHGCYEWIHPFMDGNGRSGRALWLWMMLKNGWDMRRGFLHEFYYQTLDQNSRLRTKRNPEQKLGEM